MSNLLLVGAGGFVGSVLRYSTQLLVYRVLPQHTFPIGTLVVNVLGCLAIGFLGSKAGVTEGARLFLVVGLFGGFTTFSTFGFETVDLARESSAFAAALNVALQIALGLPAVWLGSYLARSV